MVGEVVVPSVIQAGFGFHKRERAGTVTLALQDSPAVQFVQGVVHPEVDGAVPYPRQTKFDGFIQLMAGEAVFTSRQKELRQ